MAVELAVVAAVAVAAVDVAAVVYSLQQLQQPMHR